MDTNRKQYLLCRNCGCCYSKNGIFCYNEKRKSLNNDKFEEMVKDFFEELDDIKNLQESNPLPFIEGTNGYIHLCKKCGCSYSSDGLYCRMDYIMGNPIFFKK